MSIFTEKFSTGQVVAITGVSNTTLQNWIKRGVLVGHRGEKDIDGGGASGIHRRFSFNSLMEIAVAKALIDAGVTDLNHAFTAATGFSHIGHGAISGIHPIRDPALPFDTRHENGVTLLCVSGENSCVHFWKIGEDPLPAIRMMLGNARGYFILEINEIFDLVISRLGLHPEAVLEAEYRND